MLRCTYLFNQVEFTLTTDFSNLSRN